MLEGRVSYTSAIEILLLCSANRCRSPMAAALLNRHLADRGLSIAVASAGRGPEGLPASKETIGAMKGRGVELASHRSTTITAAGVGKADLVLGLAVEHVLDALSFDFDAWPRTFTLKDFVRRGEATSQWLRAESFDEWLARVRSDRSPRDVLTASSKDDVSDPIGCSRHVYERVIEDLDDLTNRVAILLAPR